MPTLVRADRPSSARGQRLPADRALQEPRSDAGSASRDGTARRAARSQSADEAIDIASLETEFKYEGYLQSPAGLRRATAKAGEVGSFLRDSASIGIPGLSREMVQRLTEVRPATLGQALRIPGVTPAAVAVVSRLHRSLPRSPTPFDRLRVWLRGISAPAWRGARPRPACRLATISPAA